MALNRKYAALPDLVSSPTHLRVFAFAAKANQSQDSAPDIYETPELTDDTSTVPVRVIPTELPYLGLY